jgi:hypothetical protein
MEGIAIGFFYMIYFVLASIAAGGIAIVVTGLAKLVSQWQPSLLRIPAWLVFAVAFLISLVLVFRAITDCVASLCFL